MVAIGPDRRGRADIETAGAAGLARARMGAQRRGKIDVARLVELADEVDQIEQRALHRRRIAGVGSEIAVAALRRREQRRSTRQVEDQVAARGRAVARRVECEGGALADVGEGDRRFRVILLLQLAEQRRFLRAGNQHRLAGGAGVMEIPDLGAAQMMVDRRRGRGAAGLGERLAVERHRRLAIAYQDLLAAELHEISGAAIEPGGAAVALFRQAPPCKDKDKREEAVLRLFCAAALLILGAAPVLAAESCEQALKDT